MAGTWKRLMGEQFALSWVYSLSHFVGYRFALFNYSTKSIGGFVDFDYFRVSNKIDGK